MVLDRIVSDGGTAPVARARQWLLTGEIYGASICLVTIIACLTTQTVTRQLPGVGWHWTGELARYAFVWSALLGIAAALEAGALHRFDTFVRRISGAARRRVEYATIVFVTLTLAYMTYYGIIIADRVAGQHSSMLRISMTWVYAALPVSSSLMLLTTALNLNHLLRKGMSSSAFEFPPDRTCHR